MLDNDGMVEGWASIACDPKVAGSSLNRFLFFNYYMVEKAMENGHVVEISLDKLIINLADESSDSAASHSNSDWFFL